MEIFALRHGPTDWNREKRLQGHRDIPLSEAGRELLKRHALPHRYRPWQWYCSPLSRARETASLLGIDRYRIASALIEMDWGRWEGERLPELRQRLGPSMAREEARGLEMQPPGGESPRQVRARLLHWLEQQPEQQPLGLVTHKGVLRSLLSAALAWEMTDKCPVKVDWSRGLLFSWSAGRLQLLDYNIELADRVPDSAT